MSLSPNFENLDTKGKLCNPDPPCLSLHILFNNLLFPYSSSQPRMSSFSSQLHVHVHEIVGGNKTCD